MRSQVQGAGRYTESMATTSPPSLPEPSQVRQVTVPTKISLGALRDIGKLLQHGGDAGQDNGRAPAHTGE